MNKTLDRLLTLGACAILLFTSGLALFSLYGPNPRLLLWVTREDGPIEWATVLALLALAFMVGKALITPPSNLPKSYLVLGWSLVALSIFGAGEEISWGQRVFGFQTGETMKALNYQQETNLHNLIPALAFNGLIIFALGLGFILIPLLWHRKGSLTPAWIPNLKVTLLMSDATLINHYRFETLPELIGILIILVLLAGQTFATIASRQINLAMIACIGWLTTGCLYHSKAVLKAANAQYEIRELLIVIIIMIWAGETLNTYRDREAQLASVT